MGSVPPETDERDTMKDPQDDDLLDYDPRPPTGPVREATLDLSIALAGCLRVARDHLGQDKYQARETVKEWIERYWHARDLAESGNRQ